MRFPILPCPTSDGKIQSTCDYELLVFVLCFFTVAAKPPERKKKQFFLPYIHPCRPQGEKCSAVTVLHHCFKGKEMIKLDLFNFTFGSLIYQNSKRTVAENNLLKSSACGPRILQLRPGVRQSRHCSSGQRVVAAFQSSDPCWPPNRADVRALAALLELFGYRVSLVQCFWHINITFEFQSNQTFRSGGESLLRKTFSEIFVERPCKVADRVK